MRRRRWGRGGAWGRALVTLATASVVALTTVPAPATPTATSDGFAELVRSHHASASVAKSLVIGVDGATYDVLRRLSLPSFRALQRVGTTSPSSLYADPMAPTLSGPGWSTIATGVWPDKHRVRDNAFTGNRFDRYPDYLTRIERARPRLSTLAMSTWQPITSTVFGPAVDRRRSGASDEATTDLAVSALRSGDPDSTFVQLDDVDHAGHDHGAASPEYAAALRVADREIGEMLAAVRARPTYRSEDWLVVVTADHGHTAAGGHGGNTPAERSTFVIASDQSRGGRGAGTVRPAVEVTDIAPTVLAHHGVRRRAAWRLDGLPMSQVRPDAFDTRSSALRPGVDEASDARGWTTGPPRGWRIDNSRMPSGGTAEWRGWSFATDPFWTDADRGQGRETNVRSRHVFAVADSDEWDDKPHGPGAFDSTLISPAYAVARARHRTLRFVTTYAVDGPQTARVLVSFDGRKPKVLRSFTRPTNGAVALRTKIPAGTRTMRVRFHYTGSNSAFWTVDQVRLTR